MGDWSRAITLLPDHWTTLIDAIRAGVVRYLHFSGIDFAALAEDALLVAVRCRGLQSLEVEGNVIPKGFVTDDRVLDLFFSSDATLQGQSLDLSLPGTGITDTFVKKFFEVCT